MIDFIIYWLMIGWVVNLVFAIASNVERKYVLNVFVAAPIWPVVIAAWVYERWGKGH